MGSLDDRWSELIAVTSEDPWSQAAGQCTGCHLAGIGCRFGIVEEARVGAEIHARILFDATHSGGPGVAHGGVVTGAFDEMSGHVPWSAGRFAVTRSITVDFRRPVPVDTPLHAVARAALVADGVWHVEATLHVEGHDALLAASHGDWVERDMGHFARFQAWRSTTMPGSPP